MTEQEMRDSKVPSILNIEDLIGYIEKLQQDSKDYGTAVYATSMAATATFNYMASHLGLTGFQAGCADLDILRRTRNMERFMIINFADALYPQYDLNDRLNKALQEVKPWLKEEAQKLLDKNSSNAVLPVVNHWKELANAE